MTIGVMHLGRTAAGPLFALELARALKEAGEHVVVVSSSDAEIAEEVTSLDVPRLAIHTFSSAIGAAFGVFRLPYIAHQINRFLSSHEVDVLVVPMEQVWQALVAPSVAKGRRVLLFVHDGSMHDGEHTAIGTWLHKRERSHADGAIVLSDHVRASIVGSGAFGADQVWKTVHPAFEAPSVAPTRSLDATRPFRIGFFGRMARYKGLELGVRAVEILRDRGRNVTFHIAGRGVPQDIPGVHADGNIVDDRWIPQDEVLTLVSSFDAVLLPYTEASQSGVFAYAMAAGIPSVVTPVGGLVEQATESQSSLIAASTSAEAIADTIERLLEDPTLYSSLSERAYQKSRDDFSWERTARDTLVAATALRAR